MNRITIIISSDDQLEAVIIDGQRRKPRQSLRQARVWLAKNGYASIESEPLADGRVRQTFERKGER